MKKLSCILVLAVLLAAGAVGAMPAPAFAQGYMYPAPPQNLYATPWVGPNTPWVNYNGDWFLNGVLHYFFGNNYGWAPYYAYGPTYIVRPTYWYGPMWNAWYQARPIYWNDFQRNYPYWRGHQHGHRYDQNFYNQHNRGQGAGWHKGSHGGPPPPDARRPDKGHGKPPDARPPDKGHGKPDARRPDKGSGKNGKRPDNGRGHHQEGHN